MENTQAEIAKLKQDVALMHQQLAQSEARLLTCLIKANAEILSFRTELAMLRDKVAKDMTAAAKDRVKRHDIVVEEMNKLWDNSRALDTIIHEIQQFLWPVVENIFPGLLKKYSTIGERFKARGTYSEAKRD